MFTLGISTMYVVINVCIITYYIIIRQYLKKALSIMEEVYGPQHPEVGTILTSLGENLINLSQKSNDSVTILNRAVTIFESQQKHRKKVSLYIFKPIYYIT